MAALLVLAVWACPGAPARDKPWRSDRLPAASAPSSPAVAARAARARALGERDRALRIHLPADPVHLNPLSDPTLWGRRITMGTVFETLLRYRGPEGGDGPGRYEPGLARSWSVAPREIRLELRDDVRFHDGSRMTAVDVQFSIDSARHPRTDADHARRALASVTAVQILGPTTVRIRLARADAYVLRELAEIPILPEHVYEDRVRARSGELVGTGPYVIESHGDQGVALARSPDYWGARPAIDEVIFVREPDAQAALVAAKDGHIDILPALIPEHYADQADAFNAEFSPVRLRPAVFRFLVMDHREPPFDDARVRRAVSLLLDREELAALRGGLARPVRGPIWPGGPGDGVWPGEPDADPEEAARLLDAAGWRDDDRDGIRERAGIRLRVLVLVTDSEDPARDQVLAALRAAGFGLDVRVGSAAVLQNRFEAGTFDLGFASWSGHADRDLAPLLGTGGRDNHGGFSDPRVDALLAEIARTWEPAARRPLMNELAALLAETAPVIGLTADDPYGFVHRRVRGARPWDGWLPLRELSLAR